MDIEYLALEEKIPDTVLPGLTALHKSVFSSAISEPDFRERLHRKKTLLCILALSEGKPVGYKIGYERNTDEFFSWLGGVAEGYRRMGIATELLKRQHKRVEELGYKRILTESGNNYREMVILNLRNGFEIAGTCADGEGNLKIIMAKRLGS
jgi:ribosomal protein S18 acetylase RimI-like enzyme